MHRKGQQPHQTEMTNFVSHWDHTYKGKSRLSIRGVSDEDTGKDEEDDKDGLGFHGDNG